MQPKNNGKQKSAPRKSPKKAEPGAFWVLEGMRTVKGRCKQMGKVEAYGPKSPIPVQHRQKENRRKIQCFRRFLAGAEGLVLAAASVGPGRSPPGCRPPRHAPQAGLRPHLVAKSYRTLTKKSGTVEAIPDFFGRGEKDLGPGCRLGRAWTQPTGLQAPTTRTAQGAAVPCCQILPHTNEKSQVPHKRYLTFLCFLSKNDAPSQKRGEKSRISAAFPQFQLLIFTTFQKRCGKRSGRFETRYYKN